MATRLDIVSDPICPWCYIGKSKLDRALEARPDHPFEVTWRPFQLNPDMPREGMDRRAYLEGKFGGPENANRIYGQIADMAEAAGLDVDLVGITRTPNTLDAHRLIHWAGIEGRQTLVVNQLFHRYFRKGEDIGDREVLAAVAESAGLDVEMIRRLLETDNDLHHVISADAEARRVGIQGVPTFLIGGKYVVTGAQEPETWKNIIDELLNATSAMAR